MGVDMKRSEARRSCTPPDTAERVCQCDTPELWSRARSMCPDCAGRLPIRRSSSSLLVFGNAAEVCAGLEHAQGRSSVQWGVFVDAEPAGGHKILVQRFPERLDSRCRRTLRFCKAVQHDMSPRWERYNSPTQTSYLMWRLELPSPTIAYTSIDRVKSADAFGFMYRCLDLLQAFANWRRPALAAGATAARSPSAVPALQAFWPGNIVAPSRSYSPLLEAHLVDVSLWSSSLHVSNPSVLPFFPPEARSQRVALGPKCDVFMIAATTYCLVFGGNPPRGPGDVGSSRKLGRKARSLLHAMLELSPAMRASVEDAQQTALELI